MTHSHKCLNELYYQNMSCTTTKYLLNILDTQQWLWFGAWPSWFIAFIIIYIKMERLCCQAMADLSFNLL